MSFVTRVLPPEEWPRLAGTEAETLWPHLVPSQSRVLVVEQGAAIVGVWVLMQLVHAECVWIAPRHRGVGSVARRLLAFMRTQARAWGARTVLAGTTDPAVGDLIAKLHGAKLPGEAYVIPLCVQGER